MLCASCGNNSTSSGNNKSAVNGNLANEELLVRSDDGLIKKRLNYLEGSLTGLQTEYYPTGVIKVEANTIEGVLDGDYKCYYPSGLTLSEGVYKNGLKTSDWVYYDNEGNLVSKGKYEDGSSLGSWLYYKQLSDSVILTEIDWRILTVDGTNIQISLPSFWSEIKVSEDFLFAASDTNEAESHPNLNLTLLDRNTELIKLVGEYYNALSSDMSSYKFTLSKKEKVGIYKKDVLLSYVAELEENEISGYEFFIRSNDLTYVLSFYSNPAILEKSDWVFDEIYRSFVVLVD